MFIFFIMNTAHSRPIPHLLVLEHKIIDQQMAYMIVNGTKRFWVKLCEADDNQTAAILKYESQINKGIEPGYYPEAEDNEDIRTLKETQNPPQLEMKSQAEYNLRERELLLISMFEFYGGKGGEEKKQIQPKSKKEVTKQQQRGTHSENRVYNYVGIKLKKQEIKGHNRLQKNQQRAQDKKNSEGEVIDVQRINPKRKLIKKQEAGPKKDQHVEIQIYDGSDSQLKML